MVQYLKVTFLTALVASHQGAGHDPVTKSHVSLRGILYIYKHSRFKNKYQKALHSSSWSPWVTPCFFHKQYTVRLFHYQSTESFLVLTGSESNQSSTDGQTDFLLLQACSSESNLHYCPFIAQFAWLLTGKPWEVLITIWASVSSCKGYNSKQLQGFLLQWEKDNSDPKAVF